MDTFLDSEVEVPNTEILQLLDEMEAIASDNRQDKAVSGSSNALSLGQGLKS